jgi:hypothetical protein
MTTWSGSEGRRAGLLTGSRRAWDGVGVAIVSSAAVDRALLAVDRMERRDDSDATMLTDVGVLVCWEDEGEIVNADALKIDKRETNAVIFMVLD